MSTDDAVVRGTTVYASERPETRGARDERKLYSLCSVSLQSIDGGYDFVLLCIKVLEGVPPGDVIVVQADDRDAVKQVYGLHTAVSAVDACSGRSDVVREEAFLAGIFPVFRPRQGEMFNIWPLFVRTSPSSLLPVFCFATRCYAISVMHKHWLRPIYTMQKKIVVWLVLETCAIRLCGNM